MKDHMTEPRILIVDDEPNNLDVLRATLKANSYRLAATITGESAVRLAARVCPSLILLDIALPGMNGLEVCRHLKEDPATAKIPVIFLTGKREKESIVEGFRAGGVDYIVKPFTAEEVLVRVQTHLKIHQLTQELTERNQALERQIAMRRQAEAERDDAEEARQAAHEQLSFVSQREAEHWGIDGFIGKSPTIARILEEIGQLQKYGTVDVLITGESGTGKELVARAIHFGGSRASKPFIPINCSTIPRDLAESQLFGHVRGAFTGATADQRGCFELANGGTLFLDEIGDMPSDIQAKLLRVLEDGVVTPVGGEQPKKIDVRVLAATNADLQQKMNDQQFRHDLYFRLAQFPVVVPPLRERPEDIPLLAEHFLGLFAAPLGMPRPALSQSALQTLTQYSFPGNVRELKQILIQAFVRSDGTEILPEHLRFPQDTAALAMTCSTIEDQEGTSWVEEVLSQTNSYSEAVRTFQRRFIGHVLEMCDWNRHKAARQLDMDRSNLIKLINKFEITGPEG